jgi:V/A-type H+-transporting ATPase subunit E
MVTIEQKLLLFSKLLNQSMEQKFNEELNEMDMKYEAMLQKSREETDKKAQDIEEKAKKQAEMKISESVSKSKVLLKKEKMLVKDKYFKIFLERLKETLKEFTRSEKYGSYLMGDIDSLCGELKSYKKDYSSIEIYLNPSDFERFSETLSIKIHEQIIDKKIEFKTVNGILGGIIAEIPENNYRIDMSMDAVLDENKSYIMQTLFESLEAGE